MFVFSLSSKKIKKYLLVTLSFIIVIGTVVLSGCFLEGVKGKNTVEPVITEVYDTSGILSFISTFGWEVDEEPDEVREVVIPVEFDEVYKNYNAIQIKQGYDLQKYSGERVKRWTYTIKNTKGQYIILLTFAFYKDKFVLF